MMDKYEALRGKLLNQLIMDDWSLDYDGGNRFTLSNEGYRLHLSNAGAMVFDPGHLCVSGVADLERITIDALDALRWRCSCCGKNSEEIGTPLAIIVDKCVPCKTGGGKIKLCGACTMYYVCLDRADGFGADFGPDSPACRTT